MAAGDFSASALVEIKLKADEIYNGSSQESNQYKAEVEAIKAILENQTARVAPLQGYQEKDNTVGIYWVDACGVADAACAADNCTITEAELETKGQAVSLALCRKTGFSIAESKLRGNIFSKEEVMAKGMLAAMKELDEYVAQQALVFLNTNAGTPLAGTFGAYTFDAPTKTLQVTAADYNAALMPFITKMAIQNKIRDSYLIDNGELYIPFMNARYNSGNDNGKGDQARFNSLPIYFDMFNFAAASITPDDTFLVGKNAVAHAHKVRYTTTPVEFPASQKRYKVASKNIPGLEYEAIYQLTCTNDELTHSWRFIYKGGFYVNPTACTATNNGIISMSKT